VACLGHGPQGRPIEPEVRALVDRDDVVDDRGTGDLLRSALAILAFAQRVRGEEGCAQLHPIVVIAALVPRGSLLCDGLTGLVSLRDLAPTCRGGFVSDGRSAPKNETAGGFSLATGRVGHTSSRIYLTNLIDRPKCVGGARESDCR